MTQSQTNIAQTNIAQEFQLKLDQASLDTQLVDLKNIDLSDSVVNLWVTEIKTSNKTKRFGEIKNLKVHDSYKKEFRDYVVQCINGNEHIEELKSIPTIQDNRFFFVESSSTDLSQLKTRVESGELSAITDEKELNNYNAYVIQLTFGEGDEEESVYAFRYIKGSWSVNNTSSKSLFSSMQNNQLIVAIDNSPRFQITSYIDFILYKSGVFISDIKQFEVAMNFHERLVEKKKEAITALGQSPAMIPRESEKLTSIIGEDKRMMRQLASVLDKQYYNNEIWLRKLKQAADQAGNWQLKFDVHGKILIDDNKNYVKELLTLLQNKRVKTVVDELTFDVEGELIAIEN